MPSILQSLKRKSGVTDDGKIDYTLTEKIPQSLRTAIAESKAGKDAAASGDNAGSGSGKAATGVRFGTQVLVSSKVMKEDDPYFLGYTPECFTVGKLYKYIIGIDSDQDKAREVLKKIRKKYPDAFLVKIEGSTVSICK